MKTIKDLKDDLSDHLFSIDKTKLSMFDLKTYCEIIKIMDDMNRPEPNELWGNVVNILEKANNNGYRPVRMKEVE